MWNNENYIWRYLLDPAYWNHHGYPTCFCYATLYFGIYELTLLPQFTTSISLYCHYIDEIFRVWFHHSNPNEDDAVWRYFQFTVNSYGNLTWTFTSHSQCTHLMDLTITLSSTGFSTSIYEKALNVYQYLPLHSSHAPDITKGFTTGLINHILTLITHTADQQSALHLLFA